MDKIFVCILTIVLVAGYSCGSNSTENKEQENTEEVSTDEGKDYHVKENGVVKLQVDGKKLEWVVLGSFTNYALRDPENVPVIENFKVDKEIQFNFLDLSDSYPEGDLVVEKTLTVSVVWFDGNKILQAGGEYQAIINFENGLSEGYSYVPYPNTYSYGTVKINKVTAIDDFHLWLEAEIQCDELSMLKVKEDSPADSEPVKLNNLKVQVNNRCRIYE